MEYLSMYDACLTRIYLMYLSILVKLHFDSKNFTNSLASALIQATSIYFLN